MRANVSDTCTRVDGQRTKEAHPSVVEACQDAKGQARQHKAESKGLVELVKLGPFFRPDEDRTQGN